MSLESALMRMAALQTWAAPPAPPPVAQSVTGPGFQAVLAQAVDDAPA